MLGNISDIELYLKDKKLDEQLNLDIYLFVSNLVVMKLYPANDDYDNEFENK